MKLKIDKKKPNLREERIAGIDFAGYGGDLGPTSQDVVARSRATRQQFGDDKEGYRQYTQDKYDRENPGSVKDGTIIPTGDKVFNVKSNVGKNKIDALFQAGDRQPAEQKLFTRDSLTAINTIHGENPEMFEVGTYLTEPAYDWISQQGGFGKVLNQMSDGIENGRIVINPKFYLEVATKLKTISGFGAEGTPKKSWGQKLKDFVGLEEQKTKGDNKPVNFTKKEILNIINEELEKIMEDDPENKGQLRRGGETHLQHIKKKSPSGASKSSAFASGSELDSSPPRPDLDALLRVMKNNPELEVHTDPASEKLLKSKVNADTGLGEDERLDLNNRIKVR